jgi:hypothetical protein
MGAITPDERAAVRARSPVGMKYDAAANRESAYEVLNKRVAEAKLPPEARTGEVAAPAPAPASKPAEEPPSKMHDFLWGTKRRQGVVEAAAKSATRSVASGLGRTIVRGVLGSIFGGRKKR